MIGAINKIAKNKDKKVSEGIALTGDLWQKLAAESNAHNLSRSEIVEHILRKALKMHTDNSRGILFKIYS